MRDQNMTAYDIMLSESQERMVIVCNKKSITKLKVIFDKYELDCIDIGSVTGDGQVKIKHDGREVANLAATLIIENAPRYRRTYNSTLPNQADERIKDRFFFSCQESFDTWQGDLALKDYSYVTDQFDSEIGLNTLIGANEADVALMSIPNSNKACGISLISMPRLLKQNPFEGARRQVALAMLELATQGLTARGISNCLNFGSPEKEAVMTDLKHAIDGMGDFASATSIPVISGNVSLYNETNGRAILPSLSLTTVGVRDESDSYTCYSYGQENDVICVLGDQPSDYTGAEEIFRNSHIEKNLIPWCADKISLLAQVVRQVAIGKISRAVSVVGRGGLLHAIVKISAKSNCGATINLDREWLGNELSVALCSVETARVVVMVKKESLQSLTKLCEGKVALNAIGTLGGDNLSINHDGINKFKASLAQLRRSYFLSLGEFFDQK